MSAIRALAAALLFVLGLQSPGPAAAPPPQTIRVPGFEQTQTWLRLVRLHKVGVLDDALRQASSMAPITQIQVMNDIQLVRLLVIEAGRQGLVGDPNKGAAATLRGRRLSLDQLAPLLGLSPEETDGAITAVAMAKADSKARTAIAQIMMRAALLHTDVAMTPLANLPSAATSPARGTASAFVLSDGRATPVVNVARSHFAIAREAMALVLPTTAGSNAARLWYLSTSAWLQGVRNYGALTPHLDTARVSYVGDAHVWLWSGAAQENLAAPALQAAAGEPGARTESPWLLYTRAESFYRHAMDLDKACAECWLRLGRVLQLTNKDDEAATFLARAEPKLETPLLKYYAALFAGRSAEALNKIPEAQAAYERAMALFPRAQSPRLSLAALAFRGPEPMHALSGIRTMFVVGGGSNETDPWWVYDIALAANWPELFADMRKTAESLMEMK